MTNKSVAVELSVPEQTMRFDKQATQFECTRGLPDSVVEKIVAAMAKLAVATGEGRLLEIGPERVRLVQVFANFDCPKLDSTTVDPCLSSFTIEWVSPLQHSA